MTLLSVGSVKRRVNVKTAKANKNFKTATIKSNVDREWSSRMSPGREMNYSILMDFLIEVNFFKRQNLYKTVAGNLPKSISHSWSPLIKLSKHDVMFQMTHSAHPLLRRATAHSEKLLTTHGGLPLTKTTPAAPGRDPGLLGFPLSLCLIIKSLPGKVHLPD